MKSVKLIALVAALAAAHAHAFDWPTAGGTATIPAGEQATVDMLSDVEGGGKGKWKDPGVDGGAGGSLTAYNTLNWISGSGTLRVRHGISGGTMLIIR